jgi:hypothetical protein
MNIEQRRILAHLPNNVTVEEWPEQTYWRWIVARAYTKGAREVKAYTTKASAMRGGQRLSKHRKGI